MCPLGLDALGLSIACCWGVCVTVWQMYFKIEILTITCIFSNALKLFVIEIV